MDLSQDDQLILIKVGFFELWLCYVSRLATDLSLTFYDGTFITRQQLELIYDVRFFVYLNSQILPRPTPLPSRVNLRQRAFVSETIQSVTWTLKLFYSLHEALEISRVLVQFRRYDNKLIDIFTTSLCVRFQQPPEFDNSLDVPLASKTLYKGLFSASVYNCKNAAPDWKT